MEERRPAASMRPMGASGASRCCWPTMSSGRAGRRRSARGRGAWDSNNPVSGPPPSLFDLQGSGHAIAPERDFPALGGGKRRLQIVDAANGLAVDGGDDIAGGKPEAIGRAATPDL